MVSEPVRNKRFSYIAGGVVLVVPVLAAVVLEPVQHSGSQEDPWLPECLLETGVHADGTRLPSIQEVDDLAASALGSEP